MARKNPYDFETVQRLLAKVDRQGKAKEPIKTWYRDAVIVPEFGVGPDVAELRDYLLGLGLAKFKVPERVVIWDELPKNDAGKVLKHRIKATLVEER